MIGGRSLCWGGGGGGGVVIPDSDEPLTSMKVSPDDCTTEPR